MFLLPRYKIAPEIIQRERLYDREKGYHHRAILERDHPHFDYAGDYYLAPSAATHSHAPTYVPPPSYVATSYSPSTSYVLASYTPSVAYAPTITYVPPSYVMDEIHYPFVAHEDLSRAYADSLQRSAHYLIVAHEDLSCGYAVSATGGTVLVFSLYAFVDPTFHR